MNPVWQDASNPPFVEAQTLRFKPPLPPGRNEVVVYLAARDLTGRTDAHVVWRRPRLEGGKQPPLLLRDVGREPAWTRRASARIRKANRRRKPVWPPPRPRRLKSICRPPCSRTGNLWSKVRSNRIASTVWCSLKCGRTRPTWPSRWPASPCVGGADLRGDPKRLETGFDAFRRCFPALPVLRQDRARRRDHQPAALLPRGRAADPPVPRRRPEARTGPPLARTRLRQPGAAGRGGQLRIVSGFVSQDGKDALEEVQGADARAGSTARADDFRKELAASEPKHLDALLDFASRAYRRPLQEKEKTDLLELYQKLRKKEMSHEEAFRTVLTRVLISPSFLYRVEQPADGQGAAARSPTGSRRRG